MNTADKSTDSNSYELHLKGFSMPEGNGTTSLRLLADLQRRLEPIASAAVRLAITGNSQAHGHPMSGLGRATDFSLNGIRAGSTVLELTAQKLGKALKGQPVGDLFASAGFDNFAEESAISVTMQAFEAAFKEDIQSPLIDKYLLQKMFGMAKLLPNNNASILLLNQQPGHEIHLTRQKLSKLELLIALVPAPSLVVLVGKLEEMKHSSGILKLALSTGELIKVLLPVSVTFEQIGPWFGQTIRVQGEANYNAAGRILALEAQNIMAADKESASMFFSKVQAPMLNKLDLAHLKSQQQYRGTNLNAVRDLVDGLDWQDDETFENLATSLTA